MYLLFKTHPIVHKNSNNISVKLRSKLVKTPPRAYLQETQITTDLASYLNHKLIKVDQPKSNNKEDVKIETT